VCRKIIDYNSIKRQYKGVIIQQNVPHLINGLKMENGNLISIEWESSVYIIDINIFSFCLYPNTHQPSGHINMSKIYDTNLYSFHLYPEIHQPSGYINMS
jgi:hypothetical protein